MIKTVLLDLDDTIFDFKKAQEIALKSTFEQFGIDPKDEVIERYDQINKYVWSQLEEKKMTRDEILVRRFEMLMDEHGIKADAQLVQDTYEAKLGKGHIYLDGAKDMLEELVKDYDLYLVSNGTAVVQDERIGSSDLANYLKGIFISERVGADKPSKEFFDYVFERIPGLNKEETVIVGDSLTSDIRGGLNAGIHTIWFNLRENPARADIVPEYETNIHSKVIELIKQI